MIPAPRLFRDGLTDGQRDLLSFLLWVAVDSVDAFCAVLRYCLGLISVLLLAVTVFLLAWPIHDLLPLQTGVAGYALGLVALKAPPRPARSREGEDL